MDITNNENDDDISFVPKKILSHRNSRWPSCEIHESEDDNGKKTISIKIIRTTHFYI